MDSSADLPPWELDDEKLMRQCRFEAFVGSGPGGQRRHRTNSAVRITHLPTGITAIEQSSRSQRENRIHALRSLRHKMALSIRREVDLATFLPPDYLKEYPGLRMSPKNPLYPRTIALVLDVMKAAHWNVAHAAVMLGVSTTALTRFLHDDHLLWAHVQKKLAELGMPPLRWER